MIGRKLDFAVFRNLFLRWYTYSFMEEFEEGELYTAAGILVEYLCICRCSALSWLSQRSATTRMARYELICLLRSVRLVSNSQPLDCV